MSSGGVLQSLADKTTSQMPTTASISSTTVRMDGGADRPILDTGSVHADALMLSSAKSVRLLVHGFGLTLLMHHAYGKMCHFLSHFL